MGKAHEETIHGEMADIGLKIQRGLIVEKKALEAIKNVIEKYAKELHTSGIEKVVVWNKKVRNITSEDQENNILGFQDTNESVNVEAADKVIDKITKDLQKAGFKNAITADFEDRNFARNDVDEIRNLQFTPPLNTSANPNSKSSSKER